jgi:hypothetical protein
MSVQSVHWSKADFAGMGHQYAKESKAKWLDQQPVARTPMQKPPLDPHVADTAPSESVLTVYDEEHVITYLRLLDADAQGADWREVARVVLHPSQPRTAASSVRLTVPNSGKPIPRSQRPQATVSSSGIDLRQEPGAGTARVEQFDDWKEVDFGRCSLDGRLTAAVIEKLLTLSFGE